MNSLGESDGTAPARDVEGGGPGQGGSSGVPAENALAEGSFSPAGVRSTRHWRESTITTDDLTDRGGVFFAAVEMTRMPMILTDPRQPDNPIVFANKAFLDLTGYEEHEVVGHNCRFLQGPQTDRDQVNEMREAIAARRPISLELLNYRRDGTAFWNAIFLGPVYGASGELLYFFASQLDVTRRRGSEDAHRHAQKMEAVGQLTAGLAHDFNNLLQVVASNLELLLAEVEQPRQRRRIENAQAAAGRASRLTGQLLAFARKTRLTPRALDLSDLVAGFAELLESTAGSRVDLQLNLRRRLPACLVDAGHLETALLNVVANARDASPGGGSIVVATARKRLEGGADGPPAGEYVELSVSDEGEGMTPEVIARATEPFFTTKGTGKGTGLGLAMVYGFVQQSRGRLEIDSRPGEGTTVRLLFPVTTAPAERIAAAGSGPEPLNEPRGRGETVLAVEDNDDVLALAREQLVSLGYRVITAADAEEALRVLAREGEVIDLLFTDLVMPGGMNGLALVEEARRGRPGLKVLLATGYNEELTRTGERSQGAPGAHDVLAKPYRRAALADRVRRALDGPVGPRRTPSDFGAVEE